MCFNPNQNSLRYNLSDEGVKFRLPAAHYDCFAEPSTRDPTLKTLDTKQAQKCIHASKLLLELAQQADWKRFESLLAVRDKLITAFVAKDYPAEEAEAVRRVVARLQMLDGQIRPLAEVAKQKALLEIRGDSTKKKAVSAYKNAQKRY